VTFPFLIFYAEFFKMWPLAVIERAEAVGGEGLSAGAEMAGAEGND